MKRLTALVKACVTAAYTHTHTHKKKRKKASVESRRMWDCICVFSADLAAVKFVKPIQRLAGSKHSCLADTARWWTDQNVSLSDITELMVLKTREAARFYETLRDPDKLRKRGARARKLDPE